MPRYSKEQIVERVGNSCKVRYCDFVGSRVCCYKCPRRNKSCFRYCKKDVRDCGNKVLIQA